MSEATVLAQRAVRVFDEVVDLPAAARAAAIERACGDDATLKRRVEDLLEADALGAEFLEVPAFEAYGSLVV